MPPGKQESARRAARRRTLERLSITNGDGIGGHLAVTYDPGPGPEVPCFLFVHGFDSIRNGEKGEFFREQARREGFGFCAFDFQGHGESSGTMRELTLTRNEDDLERVVGWLESRGHRWLVPIGSSMGGYTTLWFAARHPGRFAAAVLIAPAFQMARGFLLAAGPEGAAQWQRDGVFEFRDEQRGPRLLGWQWIEDLRAHDDEWLAANYRTPTLILQGQRDDLVPWRAVRSFADSCPHARIHLRLFPDGDHRLTDRKERLWQEIRGFVSGNHAP